jgi:hypothetical protein
MTHMAKPTHIRPVTRSTDTGKPAAVNGKEQLERRSAPRVGATDLPTFAAQLVDGPVIEIVNVSRTGILTRSEARLMPGAMIGLRILTADDSFVLFGRVVRSRLLAIDDGTPMYESALALSQDFPLLAANSSSNALAASVVSAAATRRSEEYPLEIGRLSGAPIVLTVTAFVKQRREDVMKAFDCKE